MTPFKMINQLWAPGGFRKFPRRSWNVTVVALVFPALDIFWNFWMFWTFSCCGEHVGLGQSPAAFFTCERQTIEIVWTQFSRQLKATTVINRTLGVHIVHICAVCFNPTHQFGNKFYFNEAESPFLLTVIEALFLFYAFALKSYS